MRRPESGQERDKRRTTQGTVLVDIGTFEEQNKEIQRKIHSKIADENRTSPASTDDSKVSDKHEAFSMLGWKKPHEYSVENIWFV